MCVRLHVSSVSLRAFLSMDPESSLDLGKPCLATLIVAVVGAWHSLLAVGSSVIPLRW